MRPCARSKSRVFRCSSSCFTWKVTAGWVMNSVSAAFVNERCFATAWNTWRRRSAMSGEYYIARDPYTPKLSPQPQLGRAAMDFAAARSARRLLRQAVTRIERALGLLGGRLALERLPVPAVDFLITGPFLVEPILGFRPRRNHRRCGHPTREIRRFHVELGGPVAPDRRGDHAAGSPVGPDD